MSTAHAIHDTVSVRDMPPGLYYVGDPCYSVPDERWVEWLQAANYKAEPTILFAELDGYPVVGVSTAYGDGTYPGNNGVDYPVDAGLIGVVPVEIAGSTTSLLVVFDIPFNITVYNGVIQIGHIRIDTNQDVDE